MVLYDALIAAVIKGDASTVELEVRRRQKKKLSLETFLRMDSLEA